MDNHNFDKPRLNTSEGASYLGVAVFTLRRSRTTGTLLGNPAPTYRKIGRSVLYERETLSAWVEQFDEQENTAA